MELWLGLHDQTTESTHCSLCSDQACSISCSVQPVEWLSNIERSLENWHMKQRKIGWNAWKTKEPVFCPWWRQVFLVLHLVCGRKLLNLTLENSNLWVESLAEIFLLSQKTLEGLECKCFKVVHYRKLLIHLELLIFHNVNFDHLTQVQLFHFVLSCISFNLRWWNDTDLPSLLVRLECITVLLCVCSWPIILQ